MRKLTSLLLVLTMVLTLAACAPESVDDKIDRVEDLIDDGDISEALDLIDEILDEDDMLLDVWKLRIEAYMEDEEFEDAEEALEEYYDFVMDNEDDIDDLEDVIDEILDYADDLEDEDVELGKWFNALEPPMPDLDSVEGEYTLEDVIELNLEDDVELYYSFGDEDPREDGKAYDGSISLEDLEPGEGIMLSAVYQSESGIYGDVATVFINVIDNEVVVDPNPDDVPENPDEPEDPDEPDEPSDTAVMDMVPVEVDTPSGTYDGPIEIKVTNYDENDDNLSIYYSIDGEDPREYSNWYWDYVTLNAGYYSLGLTVYNFELDEYSEPAYFDYYIENDEAIKIGFFDVTYTTYKQYRNIFENRYYHDLYIEPIMYNSIDEIDPLNLPDAVIMDTSYIEDLVSEFDILADVSEIVNLDDYDYYANALEAGKYNGTYYALPLTIKPQYVLYADWDGGFRTWEDLQGEAEWSDYKFIYGADNPELLMGIYYGLGGEPVDTESNNITLNRDKLVEAIQLVIDMPANGIGNELLTYDLAFDSMTNYNADMAVMYNYEDSADGSYYLYRVGPMPLPNDQTARYYNVVDGIMISTFTTFNSEKLDKVVQFYNFLAEDEWALNNVSYSTNALPVFYHQAMTGNSYSDIESYLYVEMIENGVTDLITYSLLDVYNKMQDPLMGIFDGATAEQIADEIMNALEQ